MAARLAGQPHIFVGVKAEQAELEDIAKPLTALDAEQDKRPDEEVAARPDPSRRSRDLGAAPITELEFSREVQKIQQALAEHGTTDRRELARLVGARFWGPGRFPAALREAVLSGCARRVDRTRFAPADETGGRFSRAEQPADREAEQPG